MTRRLLLAASTLAGLAAPGIAAAEPLSLADRFTIGSPSAIVCTAQLSQADAVYGDMFDRAYAVTCRDATAPVGRLYALRLRGNPAERLAQARANWADCDATTRDEAVEGLGTAGVMECRVRGSEVPYRAIWVSRGNTLYVAEGLAGYDSALRLGLRSLVADRVVPGEVSVALTGAGDPIAFARAQAGTLDPRRALSEAYRRNNAGAYAESAEFFSTLIGSEDNPTRAEALVNQAIQASNLGHFQEADTLFARAALLSGADPVLRRRLRNYQAVHYLNQGELQAALIELDRPLDQTMAEALDGPVVDQATSDRLNAESDGRTALDTVSGTLRPAEKVAILNGQSLQLRGTILRLQGQLDQATPILTRAAADLQAVRGGVVTSTVWMRSQIFAELAAIAEARRQPAEAQRLYTAAVTLLETDYPGSAALLSAQARLASFLARSGQVAPARALYRQMIAANAQAGTGSTVVRRALEPYFALLTGSAADAEAAGDLFLASQVAMRPGVAQTQAVLARELSAGADDNSRLFRQAVSLTRDVERTRVEISRLQAGELTPQSADRIRMLQASLAEFEQAQTATQSRLASVPRYRAVTAGSAIGLADLQAALRPDEAYYKLVVLNDAVYGLLITAGSARVFRVTGSPDDVTEMVDAIRATIVLEEDGEVVTYPFDVDSARQLHTAMFGPVAAELAPVRHLIFEPDGALLRLPINILIEDDASVATYRTRIAAPGGDPFDMRGIGWFGRSRDVSTAVSPRAFRDVRATAPSRARNEYLGFGENAPIGTVAFASRSGMRSGDGGMADCSWAITAWNRPIDAGELRTARRAVNAAGLSGAEIVTGAAFSDTAIEARQDLDQYRVVHFATHGLVTPPRPDCPTRPALLTSFGEGNSDGLLSFAEIFDLQLDADLIVLSACDTAGQAGFSVTQETGLTSGGDYALDGLVRAFVGAGGRMVVASHWPVPNVYNATQLLISGLFTAPVGTATAEALRLAETRMMDNAQTSHPFYWAAFAIIGDGMSPVIRAPEARTADAGTGSAAGTGTQVSRR